jgi:hypothetical protein
MESRSRTNYAVPAIVFAVFGVGLALALANGGYRDQGEHGNPAATTQSTTKPAAAPHGAH